MTFFAEIRYFMYDNQAKLVSLTSLIVIPHLPILPSSAISRMLAPRTCREWKSQIMSQIILAFGKYYTTFLFQETICKVSTY